jgi:glyoxylase-like metal-dependent hydrolase (beta-lactamase superfamily II)
MRDEHGIHTIDTGFQRPRFDAAYLIVEGDRAAFVDCGTALSVPRMLAALVDVGLLPGQVDWLILTHVHLDHAGGAGSLMQALPNAKLLVHRRGAPHMIDPARLLAGATAVYGEAEIARSYGQVLPVPAERVVVAEDGGTVWLGARALVTVDTPGHARHHLCVWDARSASWFTGDTFGLSYRELDGPGGAFILPTSSPVQFEPEAMQASIERMLASAPQAMYLTHYGRVDAPAVLANALVEQIRAMVALARGCEGRADRHRCLVAALTELYLERAHALGVPMDDAGVVRVLEMDIELNAQGLASWLDRPRR